MLCYTKVVNCFIILAPPLLLDITCNAHIVSSSVFLVQFLLHDEWGVLLARYCLKGRLRLTMEETAYYLTRNCFARMYISCKQTHS